MSFTQSPDQKGKLINWLTSIMSDLHDFWMHIYHFSLQSRVFYPINSYFVQNYPFNYIMLLSFRDWPSFIAADELPPIIPIVRSETGPVT